METELLTPANLPIASESSIAMEFQTSPDLATSTELPTATELLTVTGLPTSLELPTETVSAVEHSLEDKVMEVARSLKDKNLDQNPVEILRAMQKKLISGRKLEIENVTEDTAGETNFIMVDRNNVLETCFDEIMALQNKFITLEVQFYDEVSSGCKVFAKRSLSFFTPWAHETCSA